MHPLQLLIQKRNQGNLCGIPSYCTANEIVIEAILERAKILNKPTLIEATANQVNQFGGYTGMKPKDFVKFVQEIAKKVCVNEDLIILAGDHLGPLTWANENEEEAMEKASELVRDYILAGFTKIHLDTSMKLADDIGVLETEVIARRGIRLYKVCIQAYEELLKVDPKALRPVFVIGSEVPIPGGAKESEESIAVTKPEDFVATVDTYKRIFVEYGLAEGFKDIIGVVVQPGVEFSDSQVFLYDKKEAEKLCDKLKDYPEIVFEGHSTDYQSKKCLRDMVNDGIAILKVGPALTFGLREALFALSMIEKEVISITERANFIEVMDEVMIEEPENWKNYYHGNESQLGFARKYSFSDRARYYMGDSKVTAAIDKLFFNLDGIEIPLNILHQYMPIQFNKIMAEELSVKARELTKDMVYAFMSDYEYASSSGIFEKQ